MMRAQSEWPAASATAGHDGQQARHHNGCGGPGGPGTEQPFSGASGVRPARVARQGRLQERHLVGEDPARVAQVVKKWVSTNG